MTDTQRRTPGSSCYPRSESRVLGFWVPCLQCPLWLTRSNESKGKPLWDKAGEPTEAQCHPTSVLDSNVTSSQSLVMLRGSRVVARAKELTPKALQGEPRDTVCPTGPGGWVEASCPPHSGQVSGLTFPVAVTFVFIGLSHDEGCREH